LNVLDRFLKYVQYDTRSDETSKTYPSTDKQLILLRDLATELREIGLTDAAVDEHGYVMATIPATTTKPGVPTIGFIAHVDTSPEMPGTGVKPIVHRAYDGRDLVLPDDPSAVLRLADNPPLARQMGQYRDGLGYDAARRRQQGGRRRDRHRRSAPRRTSEDSARNDSHRVHAR
jgi:tripeptide aminopeptidase